MGGQFEAERDGVRFKFQEDPLAAMGWMHGQCGMEKKSQARQDCALGAGQQTQMSKWGLGRAP